MLNYMTTILLICSGTWDYVGLNYYTTFQASGGIHGKGYPIHDLDLELSQDPTWPLAGTSIWLTVSNLIFLNSRLRLSLPFNHKA